MYRVMCRCGPYVGSYLVSAPTHMVTMSMRAMAPIVMCDHGTPPFPFGKGGRGREVELRRIVRQSTALFGIIIRPQVRPQPFL